MSRTAGKQRPGTPDVAVVAHCRKSFGGGLPELRKVLAQEGITDPLWHEVNKSRRAPEYARRAAARGVDVLFVWGGDGTVQRCIDAVAGTDTAVVLTGTGSAFSAGVDLFRILDGGADYVAQFIPALVGAFDDLFGAERPVVAAVNGHAIAGGCVIAACAARSCSVPEGRAAGSFSAGTSRLVWMPASPSGAWRPIASVTPAPTSPPCATKRV